MSTTSRHIFSFVAAVGVVTSALATDDVWINNGTITTAPNVDAITVINSGIISISTTQPFETANTLNYTNTGTMIGAVGFQFSRNPSGPGVLTPAANFNNRVGGTISAQPAFITITPNGYEALNYLYVDSTNLLNQGILSIEAGGEMIVNGVDVDLSRGGLGVDPEFGIGSVNNSPSNGVFIPDLAIGDLYWRQTNQTFNSAGIIQQIGPLLAVSSPPHQVQTTFGGLITSIALLNPETFAYTNLIGGRTITLTNMDGSTNDLFVATNITRQAVFVQPDDNYAVDVRFAPSTSPTNAFRTATVEVTTPSTNFATGNIGAYTLYFVDALASASGRGVLSNYLTTITEPGYVTARPTNYLVSRLPVLEFLNGAPGNTTISNTFLYDPDTFTNAIVTGAYAGYSAQIDSLISRPPNVPGGTVTNLSGRVKVVAEGALDLTRARMQAAGLLTAETPHLISSAGAVVDAENIAFQLGSTNGQLQVQSLIKETVSRMNGQIYAWSGLWTNTANQVYENYSIDTNDMSATLDPFTNAVTVGLHTLILDAWGLIDLVPVSVHELELRSTNVVFDDRARVLADFLIDAETFTLNGSITMLGDVPNWTLATAPTLKHFTNHGVLSVPNEAHFGDDGPSPYLSYVNHGFIGAAGQTVDADYCEITGTNQTTAALSLISRSGKIESAFLNSGGDLTLLGDVFRLRESLLVTLGRLNLFMSATGSLADTGEGSANEISCQVGFALPVKPATGDLLGTTVHSISPIFALVGHNWAGDDRGATATGYTNNVALGILSLEPDSIWSDFEFQGVGETNGLYVDLLDLTLLPDYESRLIVASDLTIYFAASEGVDEEELDGALGGRLRWVKDFAGPNSSAEVLLSDGTTIVVNRALRESIQIDSDGDGLANGYDPFPFDPPMIAQVSVNAVQPAHAQISWLAGAGVVYTVECSSSAQPDDWHPLLNATNTAASSLMMTVQDPDPVGSGPRYYRVFYKP